MYISYNEDDIQDLIILRALINYVCDLYLEKKIIVIRPCYHVFIKEIFHNHIRIKMSRSKHIFGYKTFSR